MNFKKVVARDFLENLGMRNITEGDDEIVFSCPFPGHKNNDSNPSAAMSKVNKLFHCFGCKRSHNPVSFLAELEDIPHVTAEKFIAERYGDQSYEGFSVADYFRNKVDESTKEIIERVTHVNEFNPVIPWGLAETRKEALIGDPIRYLFSRGFQKETIEHFDLGYDLASDMVVIPVCSETGELLGFKGRTFRKDAPLPRYRVIGDKTGNTWGFGTVQVQHEVFNIHALESGAPVIIVEGEFDAMMLWQYGFKNVVSLYGSTFTEAQKHKMLEVSNRFILFLDSDEAGEKCRDKIVRELQDCSIIKIVEKHDGDPAELTKEECATLIENAKSQLQYYLMNIERN